MIAYMFPSRTIEDVTYVVLEDGTMVGAFRDRVPDAATEGHELCQMTAAEAHTHPGLNRALEQKRSGCIFIFKPPLVPKHFALAESGWVLAALGSGKLKDAMWQMGIKDRGLFHREYSEHYPDGYTVVYVTDPANDIDLMRARARNQMLADVKGTRGPSAS